MTTLRTACEGDIEAIVQLVNAAYRPAPGAAGWTHEGHLVAGPRIAAKQVRALFGDRSTILLLCDEQRTVACVHVKASDGVACIGMLATEPASQARGLGKQLLAHAEAHALQHFGAELLRMTVLSSRPDLLAFYGRRGYEPTGETLAYPPEAGVGEPRVAGLQLLCLEKRLPV